jgi:PTS system glucitol/sorbitol-specific IIC component
MPYKTVRVTAGSGGYGGPLLITPTDEKPYIVSALGGGIHPVATRIAALSGGQAVDAFKKGVANRQMACVVIDCGGTARCGVYPLLGVTTVNVLSVGPGGVSAASMKPDIYVSGVKPDNVTLAE